MFGIVLSYWVCIYALRNKQYRIIPLCLLVSCARIISYIRLEGWVTFLDWMELILILGAVFYSVWIFSEDKLQ